MREKRTYKQALWRSCSRCVYEL